MATKAETAIAVLTCWAVVAMARLALFMVSKTCPQGGNRFCRKRSTHVLHPMISVFWIILMFVRPGFQDMWVELLSSFRTARPHIAQVNH